MMKDEYYISDLGNKYNSIYLSKDDLAETGDKCIIYGELFTKYSDVINEVYSCTNLPAGVKNKTKGNDILFPSSTTVDSLSLIAPSAIKDQNIIIGGDMFGICLHNNFDCDAVSYILNNIYKKTLAKYAQGSTITHLYYDDIKDVKIALPSISNQRRYSNVLNKLTSKILVENDIIEKLREQKQYLLSNLFI